MAGRFMVVSLYTKTNQHPRFSVGVLGCSIAVLSVCHMVVVGILIAVVSTTDYVLEIPPILIIPGKTGWSCVLRSPSMGKSLLELGSRVRHSRGQSGL